ncbi:hypothetical protein K505DRAFT_220217, partial [Melanomma pulvis-pyrius CBS 109.77]
KEFHGHRVVLAMHSTWFLKAFTNGLKESTANIIEIHDDDPEVFEIMLKFMYGGDYDAIASEYVSEDRKYLHVDVHQLADKYDVSELCEKAGRAFGKTFKTLKDTKDLENTIREYYDMAPRSQTTIGEVMAAAVLANPTFLKSKNIDQLIREFPNFATDLLIVQRS